MNKSIWLKDGVSTFPIVQPMVGQHEFYKAYQNFLSDIKEAPMSRIFTLIAKWGIGKSRIAYELISEVLGNDKGWTIRNSEGELQTVRLLKEDFGDRILPVYIRYEQMNEDYLYGENWVGYGAYISLSKLANDKPESTIQGNIIKHLQSNLLPLGFSPEKLGEIIEKGQHSPEKLLEDIQLLDKLVKDGMKYLSKFAIDHLHIIVDEVESEYELFQDGIYENSEERKKKLDGEAIKVITSAIKHEDSRSRHPNVSFLLLCSPAIGDQIRSLEALDRRGDKLEITQNSYADISDYIESLQKQGKVRQYPEGLVEAAYTIAAGNFGWLNVVMAHCDQYLDSQPDTDVGQILIDLANSVPRFKDSLIDISQLEYIDSDPVYQPLIKKALLRQLPVPKHTYSEQEQQVLLTAKHIEGIALFREFVAIPLTKNDLGFYLVNNKYRSDANHLFVNETTGESFNLDVLIRSLETFSINAPENYFIIGKERETFLAQVRTLYPKDEVVDAAEILFGYLEQKVEQALQETYIGPNFTFLERLNRRYAVQTGIANYLLIEEKDQELQELLKERKKDYGKDIERTVLGFIRAIEQDYPDDIQILKIKGQFCGFRAHVGSNIHLGIHPKKVVDVIWSSRLEKLSDLTESNLLDIGVHPIFILSPTADTENDISKFKRDYPLAGRCIIFFQVTNLQKNVLEVLSVDRDVMDIRLVENQLTTPFRSKIRALRDEIVNKARIWFEQIDQSGYVLRPIIFTKSEEDNLPLLAEGYKKMLINNATSIEIGIKQEIKFSESEDYNRFCQVLKATEVRAKLEKDGYKGANLFIKTSEDDYEVQVPLTFTTLLSYIGNTRRVLKDIQEKFFFSSAELTKPNKIVEQWIFFLQNLKVIELQNGNHIQNVMKQTLQYQRDKVQKWRDEEYDKLVDEFKETIDKNRLGILKDDKYRSRLDIIDETLNEINISSLQADTVNPIITWREQLKLLQIFHEECNFIYDEEQWNSLQFNERMISNLNISDQNMPIWRKLRLVQLFHDYVSTLQKNILSKLNEKLEFIKQNSLYKDYLLPIVPFTNALERYQTEILYAKDYIKSSKRETMVKQSDSLAHLLWLAMYKEAIERLNTIINEIGLIKDGQNTVEWKGHNGIVGRYEEVYGKFKQIVDNFVENKSKVKKWLTYFESAPSEIKQRVKFDDLEISNNEIETFLNLGFDQQIDDYYLAHKKDALPLIQFAEGLLKEQNSKVVTLIAMLQQIESSMRKIRNEHYDQELIDTVNYIYRLQNKIPYEAEVSIAIQEDSYEKTIENIVRKMEQLDQDGRQFFSNKNAKFVRFEFFKEVVNSNADIDWGSYPREKEELENFGLIKTKVVLL
ncbi:hypothetical protein [Lysinibacillus sp. FSL P4-0201]|uniref:hypothetical protein n=1 Tax=Lysinibacillus sp. FSL P4-0201 TaxID=2921721 RepID=UPI00315A3E52